jgi:hypothetical protein
MIVPDKRGPPKIGSSSVKQCETKRVISDLHEYFDNNDTFSEGNHRDKFYETKA